ncbi:MAG: alpha/beta hydrolase [Steroidobacteraceae bacterium]
MHKSAAWRCALWLALGWLSLQVAHAVPNTQSVNTTWIEVNGVTLRYELSGTGNNTLVLLHEMGMSLETWDLIMPELTKNYRVLRYDLRGFGLSEKIRGAVTFSDEVEDLHALLKALQIDGKVTLIGGAIGGATALAYAATYPDEVRGVVAMSPAAGVAPAGRAGVMARAALVQNQPMRPIVDNDLLDIYPKSIQGDPARVARFRHIQLATDSDSMAASLRMIGITDFYADYFPKIKSPALIIAASLYAARPVESVKAIADAIKGAQFEVLPTGHFIALQSPEMLMPVLNRFLGKLPK